MQVSNVSGQNFGLRLSPSMKNELCTIYKKLSKNREGFQPEFMDKACETLITIKPQKGLLDFKLIDKQGILGLQTEKQCFLSHSNTDFLIWNKMTGLFSKHKKHLTAEDIFEIIFKIPQKIRELNI